jgi:hypothetical protein
MVNAPHSACSVFRPLVKREWELHEDGLTAEMERIAHEFDQHNLIHERQKDVYIALNFCAASPTCAAPYSMICISPVHLALMHAAHTGRVQRSQPDSGRGYGRADQPEWIQEGKF